MTKNSDLPFLSDRVLGSSFSSTVGIADRLKRKRALGEKVYDFSAGRAAEPTPKYILQETFDSALKGHTHQTMAKGTPDYRKSCADKLARENNIIADPESEIIATMGIKQGLTISFLTILNPGDEVIVEDPCFVSYQQLISYFGGKAVAVPLRAERKFRWDKDELEAAITPKTKAILFNSPQNPTGTVHTEEDLKVIVELALKHNLFVLSDEVYERTTWSNHRHTSIASFPEMRDRTITLMSLTKSFAMGGWRTGFIYANHQIVSQLEKMQQHLITSCNSFVQAGSAIAFGNPPSEEVLNYWKSWETKCEFATSFLDKIEGLSVRMPEGGFYAWTNIEQLKISSLEFSEKLLQEENVGVIPGSSFGLFGENYVRITCVREYNELKEGLKKISDFIHRNF